MEIKDRLIKMMAAEGLNSSAFADSIGVQRSSISHILSGRNKPSIDFLEKILSSYPKYNAEWLIMGTGEVSKTPKQSSLFDQEPTTKSISESKVAPLIETDSFIKQPNDAVLSDSEGAGPLNEANQGAKEEPPVNYSKSSGIGTNLGKTIDRIVIFYSDRTFSEYLPGK
jgi:transcriptional regulator with XRE-family HTH domain